MEITFHSKHVPKLICVWADIEAAGLQLNGGLNFYGAPVSKEMHRTVAFAIFLPASLGQGGCKN